VENENRLAPDLVRILLEIPKVSFDIKDVEEFLGVSNKRARAVLYYGVQMELIRLVKDHNEADMEMSLYDKASWHRKWITQKWGAVGG